MLTLQLQKLPELDGAPKFNGQRLQAMLAAIRGVSATADVYSIALVDDVTILDSLHKLGAMRSSAKVGNFGATAKKIRADPKVAP